MLISGTSCKMKIKSFLNNNKRNILEAMAIFFATFFIYFGLFLFAYITKINDQALQSEDFLPTATVPFSILKEGNLNLNEYVIMLTSNYPNPDKRSEMPFYIKQVGDNYYSFFPQFTSLLITPLYIIPSVLNLDQDIDTIRIMSRLGGAVITSLSVVAFWFILKTQKIGPRARLLLLFIYAFATNSLSTSGQGLWQHGTSQLFISFGLLSLLYKKYPLTGLLMGFAFIARPTNLLPLVFIGIFIYFATKKFKEPVKYLLFALIPIIFDFLLTTFTYGNFLNSGYATHTNHFTYNIIEGFLGMWVSPSKGLITTSPVLIFTFYGFYQAIKKPKLNNLNLYLTAIIFIHMLILGTWYNWFGGYSWGNRMASDLLPIIVFMLIPFVKSKYFRMKFFRITFVITTLIGFAIHLMAIALFDTAWHIIYDSKSRWWLWSIKNSQIIFSIQRIFYKFGLAPNPIPLEYIAE